jgi:hypothetical protein
MSSNHTRRLWLEALETRTLLAGAADPYGLVADLNLAEAALTSVGDFDASFWTNFGNHQLVLDGTSTTTLTIDLDKLPEFITHLRISSFAKVEFLGTDDIEVLVLDDVGIVDASNLTVTGSVHTDNVGSLHLADIQGTAVLKGDTMALNVKSLEDALVISDLKKLKITSDSESVYVISLNAEQKLEFTYKPQLVAVSGLPESSVSVVLPGASTPPVSDPPPVTNPPVITPPVTNPPPDLGTGSNPPPVVDVNPGSGGTTIPDPTEQPVDEPIHTTPDRVVVISLPADEQTRAFLLELRALLRNDTADTHQLVLDLLAQSAAVNVVSGLAQHRNATLTTSATMRVNVDGHLVELDGSIQFAAPPDESDSLAAMMIERGPDGEIFVDRPLDLPSNTRPIVDQPVTGPAVDVSFLVETPTHLGSEGDLSPVVPSKTNESAESEATPFVNGVIALGNYLVERVSAEFSPGQQSMIFLIDPKPSRGVGNRNSALESFAHGDGNAAVLFSANDSLDKFVWHEV